MKISTQTSYLGETYGDIEAVKRIAAAGYDAIDYSMFYMHFAGNPLGGNDYREFVKELKETADKAGIIFNQTHAPFPSYKDGDEEYNKKTFANIIRAIEITAYLKAPHTVVHPFAFGKKGRKDEEDAVNIKIYESLIPYCKKYGVKVVIENLCGADCSYSSPGELKGLIEKFDAEYIGGLIDVGHAEVSGIPAADFIKEFGGERLLGLHIHDNNKERDLHNLPYIYSFDWNAIMRALKEVGYKGDLTFEADKFLRFFPKELTFDASKFMLAVGKQLKSIFDE